jgi:hypothetical protein
LKIEPLPVRESTRAPADATRSGKYVGQVQDRGVSIDLNPGVADNNVTLSGTPSDGSLSGRWQHSTFAGARETGTFTVGRSH